MIELNKDLNKIEYLVPLPDVVSRMEELFVYPSANLVELTELISIDPALALSLLSYANALSLNLSEIDSIDKACLYLNERNIRDAISTSFLASGVKSYSSHEEYVWKHSVFSAIISASIADKVDSSLTQVAYTAGLVHNLGEMVLVQYFPDYFSKVIERSNKKKISFIKAEKEIYNFTHAQIGEKIAKFWNLPAVLKDAIGSHHNPHDLSSNSKIVAIVSFSDIICNKLGIGYDYQDDFDLDDILNTIRVDKSDVESIELHVQELINDYFALDRFS